MHLRRHSWLRYTHLIPVFALAALVSEPLVYKSIKTLRIHLDNPVLLAPANLATIEAHSLTSFGLIAGYATQGLIRGANVLPLAFVLGALAVAYAPVAVALAGAGEKKAKTPYSQFTSHLWL